jgi:hypothetical protein
MPRRDRLATAPAPATSDPPRGGPIASINPNDVFTVQGAQAALKLTRSTIGREVREGRLRIARRAGRYYLLGAWLLQWLAEGELPRRRPAQRNGHDAEAAGR